MAIAIGCGEAGTALKEKPEPYLTGCGDEVDDFGCFGDAPVLFPDIAYARSKSIGAGRNGLGRCR